MLRVLGKGIGPRLAFGFGLILLAMLALVAIALISLGVINRRLDEIVDQNVRKAERINRMSQAVHVSSRVVPTIVLLSDESALKRERERLQQARADYDRAEKEFETLANSEDERAGVARIKAAKLAARAATDKVMSILDQGQSYADAVRIILTEAGPSAQAWQTSLGEGIALQQQRNADSAAAASGVYQGARNVMLGLAMLLMMAGVALAVWITRGVTRPLEDALGTMERIRREGDLTLRAPIHGDDEVSRMGRVFNSLIERFQEIVCQVQADAQAVSQASTQLSATSAQVTQASSEQSAAAAAAAAAVDQMATSVAHVAESADQVSGLSGEGLEHTRKGRAGMEEVQQELGAVRGAVGEIAAAVEEFIRSTANIAAMTRQVRELADQTNLLALNASIEAARAGEHGRGFAVVADEVRGLAEKSRQAADGIDRVARSIGQQSESVEKSIQRGDQTLKLIVLAAGKASETVAQASNVVTQASQGVAQIAGAVAEQRIASQNIARNVEQIAHKTEQNHAATQESSRAAAHLEKLASGLQLAVSGLQA